METRTQTGKMKHKFLVELDMNRMLLEFTRPKQIVFTTYHQEYHHGWNVNLPG
jgi:hypothetical protein